MGGALMELEKKIEQATNGVGCMFFIVVIMGLYLIGAAYNQGKIENDIEILKLKVNSIENKLERM